MLWTLGLEVPFLITDLTLQDIKEVSTNYLKSVIKYGASKPEVYNMIQQELCYRTQRRSIT